MLLSMQCRSMLVGATPLERTAIKRFQERKSLDVHAPPVSAEYSTERPSQVPWCRCTNDSQRSALLAAASRSGAPSSKTATSSSSLMLKLSTAPPSSSVVGRFASGGRAAGSRQRGPRRLTVRGRAQYKAIGETSVGACQVPLLARAVMLRGAEVAFVLSGTPANNRSQY